MEKFDIEYQWRQYLEYCGLRIDLMPINQVTEIKRAFMAGLGQMYLLLVNGIRGVDDDVATNGMNEIREQLQLFWKAENNSK